MKVSDELALQWKARVPIILKGLNKHPADLGEKLGVTRQHITNMLGKNSSTTLIQFRATMHALKEMIDESEYDIRFRQIAIDEFNELERFRKGNGLR